MLHNFYGWREELETCTAPGMIYTVQEQGFLAAIKVTVLLLYLVRYSYYRLVLFHLFFFLFYFFKLYLGGCV